MIPCPICGHDQIRLIPDVYPGLEQVDYCECQACGKSFDVRITWEGVQLAPVFYGGGDQ